MAILLIEDEVKLTEVLKKGLEMEHYSVDVAYDGKQGFELALTRNYDIIILDLMLPKKDGLDVCRELRQKKIATPILMLTARDTVGDRVRGLNVGGDDYLTKPFDFDELLARIRALMRREKVVKPVQLRVGDLTLDPVSHEVRRGGRPINLTHTEYVLLEYLMRYAGEVLTRDRLMEHIWRVTTTTTTTTTTSHPVNVYIRYLRRKIDDPFRFRKKLIQTIRGAGYMIKE